jgi:hypothetical protein
LVHLHDYLDETALPDGMPRYTKLV